MMKKFVVILTVILFIGAGVTGCQPKQETLYPGIKAVIVEVDAKQNGVYVKDAPNASETLFGERCFIDCRDAGEKSKLIYCNLNTGSVQYITVEELQEGDEIEIDLKESERKRALKGTASAGRLQLMTQRMNT